LSFFIEPAISRGNRIRGQAEIPARFIWIRRQSRCQRVSKSFEENIKTLYSEIELAIQWKRPSILLAICKSKLSQIKAENALERSGKELGQSIERIIVDEKSPTRHKRSWKMEACRINQSSSCQISIKAAAMTVKMPTEFSIYIGSYSSNRSEMRVLAYPQRSIQSAKVRSGFLGFSPSGHRVRKSARFNQNKSACRRFDLAYTRFRRFSRKASRIKFDPAGIT
jgi:hypothetical protein